MTQTLTWLARVTAVLLTFLALWAAPSAAQDVTAEVRTWDGQSWRIAQPSLEVFYTIPAPPGPNATDSYTAPPAGTAGAMSNVQQGLSISGPVGALESYFDAGPGPRQGHRQADYITVRRGAIERQLPLASIVSLTFTRHAIRSTLPPYYAARHFRYTATAVLTDGSQFDADYVNLGTLVLRGQTGEGRLDLPWQEIESVRFQR